jgi:ribosomal-protein-alanine N-acetyltransferase
MEVQMNIQHKGSVTIETLRLILRRFEEKDAKDMYQNWAGDPEVCKYLSWGPHSSEEVSRKRILAWVSNYFRPNSYVWALELKRTGAVVGSISVEIADDKAGNCEVGYCLGRDCWKQGLMTEAMMAVIHYLFYEIGYQTIQAKHDVLNIASGRVMQKSGMTYFKTEQKVGVRRDGTYYDCDVYIKHIDEE